MSSDVILRTENLRREFGALVAVDDVTMQVQAHTLHSIIGPNGAGKTTFFNLLSGNRYLNNRYVCNETSNLLPVFILFSASACLIPSAPPVSLPSRHPLHTRAVAPAPCGG